MIGYGDMISDQDVGSGGDDSLSCGGNGDVLAPDRCSARQQPNSVTAMVKRMMSGKRVYVPKGGECRGREKNMEGSCC